MKAILVKEDKSLVWENVPDPKCGDEDCLIRIHAAALNRADLMQRAGDYPPPPGCPEWMGLEIAGEIIEMGKVAKERSFWKIGDRVCALLGGGGYAQFANVKYDMLMPIPEGCSMIEAAAMPEAFATAYLNMFWEGKIEEGDTLLVTGGNSGLASVIIPMARAFRIRTITTVRNAAKKAAIAHLKADRVVDCEKEVLSDVLKEELEAGRPISVAIDCLGGENMGECLRYLKHGARWIMIAALAGTNTQIDLKNIYVRNVRIIGSTLRSRSVEVKAKILKELTEKVWPLVAKGEIKPTVHAVFPIVEAEKAQNMLYEGKNIGKVVLQVI